MGSSPFSHSKKKKSEIKLQCYGMFKNTSAMHRELCSMLCGSLDGKRVWGRMDSYIHMAEAVCCPPEIITALLIGYAAAAGKLFQSRQTLCDPMTAAC